MPRPAEALHRLLEVLDRMEIPYYVGGSVASSAYGIPPPVRRIVSSADATAHWTCSGPRDWIFRNARRANSTRLYSSLHRGNRSNLYAVAARYHSKLAGETSERQWSDLRGILRVSGAELDRAYLRRWAVHLKVDDLLDRLLRE